MPAKNHDPSGLSIGEVARRFKVSAETIRRWEKAGLLSAERPDGKNRLFNRQQVAELLAREPYTISQAAQELGISTNRLLELERSGQLTPDWMGGKERLFAKSTITKYVQQQARQSSGYTSQAPQIAAMGGLPAEMAGNFGALIPPEFPLPTHATHQNRFTLSQSKGRPAGAPGPRSLGEVGLAQAGMSRLLILLSALALLLLVITRASSVATALTVTLIATLVSIVALKKYLPESHSMSTLLFPGSGATFAQNAPTGTSGEVLISYHSYQQLHRRLKTSLIIITLAAASILLGLKVLPVISATLLLPVIGIASLAGLYAIYSLITLAPRGERVNALKALVRTDPRIAFARYAPTEQTGALKVGYVTYKKLYKAATLSLGALILLVILGLGREIYLARMNADQNFRAASQQFGVVLDSLTRGQGSLQEELQKLAAQSLQTAPGINTDSLTQQIIDQVTANLPEPPTEIVKETETQTITERTIVQTDTAQSIQLEGSGQYVVKDNRGVTIFSFGPNNEVTLEESSLFNIAGAWNINGVRVTTNAPDLNDLPSLLNDTRFLVTQGNDTLDQERILTAGAGITLTDSGANNAFTISSNSATLTLATGTTDTDATAGSVFFAGTAGVLQQDNANFFWDDANNRLGVGTSSPEAQLDLKNGSAGSVSPYSAAQVVLESSGAENYLSFLSPATGEAGLLFGHPSPGSNTTGYLTYRGPSASSPTNGFVFGINGGNLLFYTANSFAFQGAHTISTSSGNLTLTPGSNVIVSSGNVGIGTTSPSYALDVSNNTGLLARFQSTGSTPVYIESSTAGTSTLGLGDSIDLDIGRIAYSNSADALSLWTNNTERFSIDATGNVGIGTTAPGQKLEVSGGNILASGTVTGTSGLRLGVSTALQTANGGALTWGSMNGAGGNTLAISGFTDGISLSNNVNFGSNTLSGDGNATIKFQTAAGPNDTPRILFTGSQGNDPGNPIFRFWDNNAYADHRVFGVGGGTTYTEYLTIKNNGNVGIGTTAPSAKLHVLGTSGESVRIAGSGTSAEMHFYESSTLRGIIGWGDAGNIFSASLDDAMKIRAQGALQIGTNGDNVRMTVDTTGNVGIGTTAPTGTGSTVLQVAGTGGGASQYGSLSLSNASNSGGNFAGSVDYYAGGNLAAAVRGQLVSGGNVGQLIFYTATTGGTLAGRWTIQNDGKLINSSNSNNESAGTVATAFALTGQNATNTIRLMNLVNGATSNNSNSEIGFTSINDLAAGIDVAAIRAIKSTSTAGAEVGELAFYTRNAGTLQESVRFAGNGNVGINTTVFGTDCAKCLAIAGSTAPSASITDGIQLFAVDIAGSHELRVRDEAGNVTTLSPHNFNLFEPREDYYLPWSYTSEKGTAAINVDMYGAIQQIELLSGKHFIYGKDLKSGETFTPTTLTGILSVPEAFEETNVRLAAIEEQAKGLVASSSELGNRVTALETTPAPEQGLPAELAGGENDDSSSPQLPATSYQLLNSTTALDIDSIIIRSDATIYGTLLTDTLEVATALNLHGDATIWGSLLVKGDVELEANARVAGTLTVSNQQAGFAEIPEGTTEVKIEFAKKFSDTPVISITPRGVPTSYWGMVDDNENGFTIRLAAPAPEPIRFTWTAFPVTEPTTTIGTKTTPTSEQGLPAELAGGENHADDNVVTPPYEGGVSPAGDGVVEETSSTNYQLLTTN